ncbi:MAG: hypothetical protein GY953_52995, partial [bacterium]|nr:hypothetical protein [bacterium]
MRKLQRMFQEEPELILAFLEPGDDSTSPDIQTLLDAARSAADRRPKYADLQYFAARTAYAADELEDAERLARRAVDLNPSYRDALILATRVARRLTGPR